MKETQDPLQIRSDKSIDQMNAMIQTDVDSRYVYAYDQTRFVPPPGKTLLIMGQTVERIDEYMERFPDQTIPGGWSAYWPVNEFEGITKTHKNETGSSQNHQMLIDKFPNTVVQSAMWMVGNWDIAEKASLGFYDENIKRYAQWAKTTNRPIYLRIGYEFDGPHNALEPDLYVRIYRRIVDILRAEKVDNIAFVWHSYAHKTYKNYPLSSWYPGDDYVDWVGVSVFDHAYDGIDLGKEGEAVLDFAKVHKKPVMIAESNPIFGIESDNPEVWEQWFANFFSMTYRKNIKAISFINENWNQTNIPGISEWKDARLYNNVEVSSAWFRETNKGRYLKQSPELYKQLGFQ